jgi:hypothetical protein
VTTQTQEARSAQSLIHAARSAGFLPGVPPTVSEAARSVDASLCRRLRCPGCERRGMVFQPFRNGTRYKVIACCPACGAGDER